MYMAIKMKKKDMNLKDIKESYLDLKKRKGKREAMQL